MRFLRQFDIGFLSEDWAVFITVVPVSKHDHNIGLVSRVVTSQQQAHGGTGAMPLNEKTHMTLPIPNKIIDIRSFVMYLFLMLNSCPPKMREGKGRYCPPGQCVQLCGWPASYINIPNVKMRWGIRSMGNQAKFNIGLKLYHAATTSFHKLLKVSVH